mgnify:CR=1 FL=1
MIPKECKRHWENEPAEGLTLSVKADQSFDRRSVSSHRGGGDLGSGHQPGDCRMRASRNPELHFVFARMGMAEEQGLGIRSLRDRAKELGLVRKTESGPSIEYEVI